MASMPALEPFKVAGPPSTQAAKWREWVERLEHYFTAVGAANSKKRSMLIHLAGEGIYRISKHVVEAGPPFTYNSLKNAITAHFQPLANPDYEWFVLRQAFQKPEESVDEFYNKLRELASTCTLPDTEAEIRAQFIAGCASTKLQELILQDHHRTMQDILTLGWSKELSKARAPHMEAALQHPVKAEPVNLIRKTRPSDPRREGKGQTSGRTCGLCGGSFPHSGDCPAKGRKCSVCSKLNHYAKVCR